MKWAWDWHDPFTPYLAPVALRRGDRRTWTTVTAPVRGSIGGGALICQPIAVPSPMRRPVNKGAQRRLRMVKGEPPKRAPNLDADHLTAQLRSMTRPLPATYFYPLQCEHAICIGSTAWHRNRRDDSLCSLAMTH